MWGEKNSEKNIWPVKPGTMNEADFIQSMSTIWWLRDFLYSSNESNAHQLKVVTVRRCVLLHDRR